MPDATRLRALGNLLALYQGVTDSTTLLSPLRVALRQSPFTLRALSAKASTVGLIGVRY